MTFLAVSLLIFSIIILFTTILLIIWWKKYGKPMFFILKDLKNAQKKTNNLDNLANMEKFYQNMSKYGGQLGNFDKNLENISKKINKK